MRSNWALLGWTLGPAAVVAVIMQSTPNPLPFLIIAVLVVYFGNSIVDRLAQVPSINGLQSECPAHYLHIETVNFSENEFKVWFVDGNWEAGRSFVMSGTPAFPLDPPIDGMRIAERLAVRIYTLPGWFETSRIGTVSETGSCYIGLPVPLAMQVLDDLRKNSRQTLTIGFKEEAGRNGKPSFPIYLFEMSDR